MNYLVIAIFAFLNPLLEIKSEFEPTWESLANRTTPEWFSRAKFGILIHWSLYAAQGIFGETFYDEWLVDGQPSVVNYIKKYFPDEFKYKDLIPLFTCEFFDANKWMNMVQSSGARYVIVTAKYNDGYTLWKSPFSIKWNSATTGPKRSFINELAGEFQNSSDIHFGLHYSLQDVFNPLYVGDRESGFLKNYYTLKKLLPELKEMVNTFRPEIIWIDGPTSSDALPSYYNSTHFLAWLYNSSPTKDTVVVNDKWGKGTSCKYGSYFSCSPPAHTTHSKKNKPYVWESTFGINRQSLGHRAISSLQDYRTTEEIIEALVSTVSLGGNLLLTIGATKDGRIVPYVEERLREVGQWLKLNGEAIFDSVPWKYYRDSTNRNIWYTSKVVDNEVIVYIFLLKWPSDNIVRLQDPKVTPKTNITLIGYQKCVDFKTGSNGLGITIELPDFLPHQLNPWSWVFKMTQ